jgi:hypothetical protein
LGEVQAAQAPGAVESRRHWKEATPDPPGSAPEKEKLAAVLLVSAGGLESIVVLGAMVSTLQLKVAEVASVLPAWSIARTSKVWEPSASELRLRGEVQEAQAPGAVESKRHWKEATPEPPASEPEKVKLAAALLLSADGLESIVVFGAAVSTFQLKVAGVASVLPA